ncbi:MAG TPA: pilus assembly protein N-terminal domain-containing protein [Alphaproteobacteria bacterium]|nr:hypothetical protein [Rhodospirillaceae bacterium]HRJ67024.1 pilus assembly protein N-terminal domain-containing protein [Alphaproteobacteria bacterium]
MKHRFTAWGLAALVAFTGFAAYADGVEQMSRLLKTGDSAASATAAQKAAAANGDPLAIRLTPDRTKILRLRENAASVIVANPAHATVSLDSPRLLILMPREPGTTSFTVLNAAGKVLLERNIIVSGAQPQYVRVRRVCGNDNACQSSSYHYCPDGCFEVTPVTHEGSGNIPEVQGAAAPAAAAAEAAQNVEGAASEEPMIVEELEGPAPDSGDSAEEMPEDMPETLEGQQ